MAFKIEDVPKEVLDVWHIRMACPFGVGLKLYLKCKDAEKKYPEWFPEDKNAELPLKIKKDATKRTTL